MLAVLLTDLGLLLTFTGLVAVVRPVRRLGLRTRGRGGAVALIGVLLAVAAVTLPARALTVARPATELDRVLPTYQFNEVHAIEVQAAPDQAYRAIKAVTADDVRFFRTLVWIRRFGRPGPESILNVPAGAPILDVATRTTFARLTDSPKEIVVGTVVVAPAGWRRQRPQDPGEFLSLRSRPGFALAAMSFLVTPRADGTSVVSTETRVFATDAGARRRFAPYWRVIYPGSALIRRMWLRAIRDRAAKPVGKP